MIKGTDMVRAFEEGLPRLMLDLKYIDKEGFCWYPTVVDKIEEGKYMIFPDGTSKDDWKWALSVAVLIPPSERSKFKKPDGTFMKYKNSSDVLHFDNDKFSAVIDAANMV